MDYEYIKNHYRLVAVDLKSIQQIEFVEQLKNPVDAVVADKSMFV